jgi:hypothetical protein
MTSGVISFRVVGAGLVPLAGVPLVYAGAMAVEAVAALSTGDLFDLSATPALVSRRSAGETAYAPDGCGIMPNCVSRETWS